MSRCDWITVFLAVLPVVGTLAGFGIGHYFESKRQEAQREHDRQERRRETRRQTLVDLQRALADVRDGSEIAAMLLYTDPTTGIDAARAALTEPWFQTWRAAANQVSTVTAQLSDKQLINLARSVGVEMQAVIAARNDHAKFRAAIDQLHVIYEEANTIAGSHIQDLDSQ